MKAEQINKLQETIAELTKQGYKRHHEASCRGYCKVGSIGNALKYDGKFGTGYIVVLGRHNESTSFTQIAYYVK